MGLTARHTLMGAIFLTEAAAVGIYQNDHKLTSAAMFLLAYFTAVIVAVVAALTICRYLTRERAPRAVQPIKAPPVAPAALVPVQRLSPAVERLRHAVRNPSDACIPADDLALIWEGNQDL